MSYFWGGFVSYVGYVESKVGVNLTNIAKCNTRTFSSPPHPSPVLSAIFQELAIIDFSRVSNA